MVTEFCIKLQNQSFFQPSFGILSQNCFIENFILYMKKKCFNEMDETDKSPCCKTASFPFEPHVFELCLPRYISSLYATSRQFFTPSVAGPKFSTVNKRNETNIPVVSALVIEYESNFSYTMSYFEVKQFLTTVQAWFDAELLTAPKEMLGGWFISELEFYDLQDALSKSTMISIAVATCTSLLILLIVTFNVLISIYAVLTVSLTILTTIAVLILLGWKLNILESISVSTAVGLAFDFSLHYGIQYRYSLNSDRVTAAISTLSRIIAPITMASLTTAAAGASMLASNVLPYIQIGIFLVVVMSISWIYATFFFVALMKIIGPQYGFMQCRYPSIGILTKYNFKFRGHQTTSDPLGTSSNSALGALLDPTSHELSILSSNTTSKI